MLASKNQSHSLLFTLDPPLPQEIQTQPIPAAAQEARREAQAKFAEYIKNEGHLSPLLVARFIARQVAGETQKLVRATSPVTAANAGNSENDFTDSEDVAEKYVLADHLERLRYLEMPPNKKEAELIKGVLSTALPGLEEFITEEKHATFSGKMAYNAFGVCFGGGRTDRVCIRLFPSYWLY
jgi:import receptor subunit TOM20